MYPIYAVVLIVVFWFLHLLISSFIKSKEKSLVLLIGLATVITMRGWELQKWPFLHEASESLLEASKEYADVDCIIVHDIPFRTQTAYFEMQNYRSSTFISRSNLNMIDDLDFYECNELIVLLRNDEKDVSGVLNTFINAFPQLDAWEEVGGHLYTKTYHLYGEAREGR